MKKLKTKTVTITIPLDVLKDLRIHIRKGMNLVNEEVGIAEPINTEYLYQVFKEGYDLLDKIIGEDDE